MELAHRWINRDLSKLELIVSILLISILIGIFIRYSLTVFAAVEKKMVERTVMNIETAINYHASIAIFKKDNLALTKILTSNPIDLMVNESEINPNLVDGISYKYLASSFVPPENYAGIVLDDTNNELEKGFWYFDSDDRFLFYTVINDELLKSKLPGISRLRYKMIIEHEDIDNNQYSEFNNDFLSIKLVQIDRISWSI